MEWQEKVEAESVRERARRKEGRSNEICLGLGALTGLNRWIRDSAGSKILAMI
ncbi:hypothetical protein NC651_020045 [Populus alba x Populus x berolinensis]|nr:hypothetical protein NC651_020045 [Populus alba x Populus x berolinensis]